MISWAFPCTLVSCEGGGRGDFSGIPLYTGMLS